MNVFVMAKCLVLTTCLGAALFQDIKERKIRNITTFPAAILGIVINSLQSGPGGMLISVKGWFITTVVLIGLYYINVMGAGDIKLFAAIGAFMGIEFTLYSFAYSVFIGGVIAAAILIYRKQLKEKLRCVSSYLQFVFFTRQFPAYSSKDDTSSKFIFSTAIVPGTLFQLYLSIN